MTVNELIKEMQGQVARDPSIGELQVLARDEYGAWQDVDNYCAFTGDEYRPALMRYLMGA